MHTVRVRAPRSKRSNVLLCVLVPLVAALYFTQFWFDNGTPVYVALVCSWLVCFAAYLASRAQDVRQWDGGVQLHRGAG
jgi:hypothetical protein